MNLTWAHSGQDRAAFVEGIAPGMGRHCDLAYFAKPLGATDAPTLNLLLEVSPTSHSDILTVGGHRLELHVAAANCRRVDYELDINFTGEWTDDEDSMFQNKLTASLRRARQPR